jgi:hypothetical protein
MISRQRVFFSYSIHKLALCAQVGQQLTADNISRWIDLDTIGWSQDWQTVVQEVITRCDLFVPFICDRYFKSTNCRFELRLAQYSQRRIAAVVFEPQRLDDTIADSRLVVDQSISLDSMHQAVLNYIRSELR